MVREDLHETYARPPGNTKRQKDDGHGNDSARRLECTTGIEGQLSPTAVILVILVAEVAPTFLFPRGEAVENERSRDVSAETLRTSAGSRRGTVGGSRRRRVAPMLISIGKVALTPFVASRSGCFAKLISRRQQASPDRPDA